MPRRPTTPRGPEPVGALLIDAGRVALGRARAAVDRETWREVVGDRIARRAAPGSLDGDVLTVVVESPVWAQELSLLSDEIVGRLAATGLRVARIRFRTGRVAAAAPAAKRLPKPPPPVELPEDVKSHLEGVEDDELRRTIASAIAHSLANTERREGARVTRKPAARAPRSAGPGSDPPAPVDPTPSAKSRRSRGAGRG